MTSAEIKYSVLELYINNPFCSRMIALNSAYWNRLINAHNPVFVDYLDSYTIRLALNILVTYLPHYNLDGYDAEVALIPHNGISNIKFYRVNFNKPTELHEVMKSKYDDEV